ncbi:hypothetical protein BB561_006753 [Smittium simulii]|uniref:Oxidoreductase-like domain-containing protein n=1 Tax=Smittium simulii TaxID=133385 RepID=A0A2T9Y1V3_9FUNG|nr:hypothetical protein BB561_006753 [Smittium simulii]
MSKSTSKNKIAIYLEQVRLAKLKSSTKKTITKSAQAHKKPIKPKASDCCNSGCYPCVFDLYDEQLELYKLELSKKNCKANVDIEDIALKPSNPLSLNNYGKSLL